MQPVDLVERCKKDYSLIPYAQDLARTEVNNRPRHTWEAYPADQHVEVMKKYWPVLSAFSAAGYKDIPLFSKFFFGHLIRGDVPEHHREFYDAYNYGYGYKRICDVEPRGFGKTAKLKILVWHGIAYFNVYGWRNHIPELMTGHPFTVIGSASAGHSEKTLTAIKFELEFNDLYNAAFCPPQHTCMRVHSHRSYFSWNIDSIVTANGAQVDAIGRGSQVRGRNNYMGFRITLFLGDDLEGERDTTNPKIIEETRYWYHNAVIPSLYDFPDYEGISLLSGTVVHENCLVNFIRKKDKSYFIIFRQAIIHDANGKKCSLWEEMKPLAKLEKAREKAEDRGLLNAWMQEFMNEPISYAERPFDPSKVKVWHGEYGWNDRIKQGFLRVEWMMLPDGTKQQRNEIIPVDIYIGVDLASTETKSSDFSVIMIAAIDNSGNIYILKYWRKRVSLPTLVRDQILDFQKRFQAKIVVIEAVGYQHTMWALVRNIQVKENRSFRLIPEKHPPSLSKPDRIANDLEPKFSIGTIVLRDAGMHELRREMIDFPQSEHDDCLDSLQMCLKYMRFCPYKDLPDYNEYLAEMAEYDESNVSPLVLL